MNILVNLPYNIFEASSQKKYTGPLHFSSMLIKDLKASKDKFIGLVFEKIPPQTRPTLRYRIVKNGKETWIVLNVWVPTSQIITSNKTKDPDVDEIIVGLKSAIASVNPDVFFLNGFSALTFLVMRAIRELGIPMICTHHGIWLKEYMALNKSLIKTPIKDRKEMERGTVRFAKKNIFLSKLSLREFEKHLIKVPKQQLEFIKIPYNPVFVNKKYPAPKKNSNKLNIVMVGRWDAVKNHEGYLALAKKAKKLGLPWVFHTITNIGEYEHYQSIKEEYLKYIQVEPTVPAKKLKKIYQKNNLVVVPSHFDVYPGVVTEAILQNRPILISENVGWEDEFKRHGKKHWIVDFKKPDVVIERIKKVSQEQVPNSLYAEVLKNNDPKFVFKKYRQIFQQIGRNNK